MLNFFNLEKLLYKTILLLLCLWGGGLVSYAQITSTTTDSSDSTIVSDVKKDSLNTTDSLQAKTKKDIETTIVYSAQDSIRMDVVRQIVYLYGKAKITYGAINLEAEKIEIDWGSNMLTAYSGNDTTGKQIGIPVFKQGSEMYTSEVIKYNFKSKKGLISKLVTQQGEGYIHGETVKKHNEEMYVKHARYTTCNLAHPHFYINASKLKLVPEDKIVSGPFNVVVADVPTPFGFFLGMFPVPKKNKSGLIFPSYGENQARGFFLSRIGYYWAVNDYMRVQLTGDFYSKGTTGFYLNTTYLKRYAYSGNFNFNLFQARDNTELNNKTISNYNLTWSHSTDQTGRTGSLSASVNISSPQYNAVNSYNQNTRLANDFSSYVNYRKTFARSPFSLNVNLSQSQNVSTKFMSVTFPELFFTMNRIYPFKKKGGLGKAWYEQIAVNYSLNAKMAFDNGFQRYDPVSNTYTRIDSGLSVADPNTFSALFNGGSYYHYKDSSHAIGNEPSYNEKKGEKILLNGAQYGAKHSVPITTTFKIFKNFSLNPSLNYTEYWFPRREIYSTVKGASGNDSLVSQTENGFSRAFGWSTSGTNLRTNIYGTYNFKKGKLMGIRHTMTPSIGYSFSPDLTSDFYGAYQEVRDQDGNLVYQNGKPMKVSHYSKYTKLYGAPGGTMSQLLTFSLNNVVEAKVRNPKDTANPTKKFKPLDNLSLNANYNLEADSFALSAISMNARTNIKDGKAVLSFSSNWDPYYYMRNTGVARDLYGHIQYKRVNKLDSPKLMSANLALTTSFNPKAKNKEAEKKVSKEEQDHLNYIKANPQFYLDFKIPWNIYVSYQLNFFGNKFVYGSKNRIFTNSISVNGDISLTEKTKATFSTSYDIVHRQMPVATLGIVRDLHCWQMAFNITNYNGVYTYFFNINAKSSLLQDLKLTKRSPNMNNAASF